MSVCFYRLYVEDVTGEGSGYSRFYGTRYFAGSPVIEHNLAGLRALSERIYGFGVSAFIEFYELAIGQHQAKSLGAHAYRTHAGFNSMFHFNAAIYACGVNERTGPVASFGADCLCVHRLTRSNMRAPVIPADYLLFIIPQLEPFQSLDVL